jgi:hypothetical protein
MAYPKGRREAVNLTNEQGHFIRRRVSVLLQPDRAIIDLIADGYVQGMSDALALQQKDQPQ